MNYELQPIMIDDDDITICDPTEATHWAIYWRRSDGRAVHRGDYETYSEASQALSKFLADQSSSIAQQAAMFGFLVNMEDFYAAENRSCERSQAALSSLLVSQAADFEAHHIEADLDSDSDCYWDDHDWYEETDSWFFQKIAPALY